MPMMIPVLIARTTDNGEFRTDPDGGIGWVLVPHPISLDGEPLRNGNAAAGGASGLLLRACCPGLLLGVILLLQGDLNVMNEILHGLTKRFRRQPGAEGEGFATVLEVLREPEMCRPGAVAP